MLLRSSHSKCLYAYMCSGLHTVCVQKKSRLFPFKLLGSVGIHYITSEVLQIRATVPCDAQKQHAASPHSSASWWTSASSSPERQHWTMTAQENCSWKCSFTHMENNIIHIDNVPTWASLDFSKNRRGNGETGNIYIDHLQQCRQDR